MNLCVEGWRGIVLSSRASFRNKTLYIIHKKMWVDLETLSGDLIWHKKYFGAFEYPSKYIVT